MALRSLRRLEISSTVVALACSLSGGVNCAAASEIPDPFPTSASVSSIVTKTGPATWTYQLTIHNDSEPHTFDPIGSVPFVYWLLIPYFPDAGIADITCPGMCWTASHQEGWFPKVYPVGSVGGSPGFGNPGDPNSLALSWEWSADTPGVAPGTSLSGFGFTASYAPVKGPFNLRFALGQEVLGDPAIPGSPLAWVDGYRTPFPVTAVPEADTLAMMLAGLGLLGMASLRRRFTTTPAVSARSTA